MIDHYSDLAIIRLVCICRMRICGHFSRKRFIVTVELHDGDRLVRFYTRSCVQMQATREDGPQASSDLVIAKQYFQECDMHHIFCCRICVNMTMAISISIRSATPHADTTRSMVPGGGFEAPCCTPICLP